MRPIARLAALACLAALASPAIAFADTNGDRGKVVELTVNEPSSDEFPKFHGSVEIRADDKSTTVYHWGGSFCPGQTLSSDSVDRLYNAFLTRRWTKVVPHYKNGQGGNKCLVGYELEGKANDGPN